LKADHYIKRKQALGLGASYLDPPSASIRYAQQLQQALKFLAASNSAKKALLYV
jgi:hypothetical protein